MPLQPFVRNTIAAGPQWVLNLILLAASGSLQTCLVITFCSGSGAIFPAMPAQPTVMFTASRMTAPWHSWLTRVLASSIDEPSMITLQKPLR
jgi:hypothetical protein